MPLAHISRENIALFKYAMRTIWPSLVSSHADEAIAAYCGFRTYAALLAALPPREEIRNVKTSPDALMDRLVSLGYRFSPADLDRVIRVFHADMLARINKNFTLMKNQTANDNRSL